MASAAATPAWLPGTLLGQAENGLQLVASVCPTVVVIGRTET